MVWFEGGYGGRRLYADHQGSIVAIAHPTNAWLAINGYDPWGIPNPSNAGRFQYTGQVWLPELGMYYYKARVYSPTLGRFLQTDPIGYQDQINLYAYAANDPVNRIDPTGTTCKEVGEQKGGATKYECRIDSVSEKKNGEWVKRAPNAQENKRFEGFNRRYTNAVNALARNPDRNVRIPNLHGSKGSFQTTAGNAAASLISRNFNYLDQSTNMRATLITAGLPDAEGRIRDAETIVTSQGLAATERAIVHDGGMHSTPQEASGGLLRPGYPLARIPHDREYNRAACILLGEDNC